MTGHCMYWSKERRPSAILCFYKQVKHNFTCTILPVIFREDMHKHTGHPPAISAAIVGPSHLAMKAEQVINAKQLPRPQTWTTSFSCANDSATSCLGRAVSDHIGKHARSTGCSHALQILWERANPRIQTWA